MSTKTFDHVMDTAPATDRERPRAKFFAPFLEACNQLNKAVVASHLVDKGMDPREAFDRVYKNTRNWDL